MKKRIIFLLIFIFTLESSVFSQEDLIISKGDKLMGEQKYNEAIREYSKALKKNPDKFIVYYKRGNAYLFANILDSAVYDFTKFIEKDTTSPDAYNNRGIAYNYIGSYDVALMDFDKAYNLDTNFSEALINRATAYFNLGLSVEAYRDFDAAQRKAPNNPQLYYQRGRLSYYKKDYKYAIEDFTKAINLGLKNSKIYYNRANAYFKTEQFEKAIKDYTKVLDLNPNDTEALNNRAVSYDKIGKNQLAEKDRNKLKSLVKSNPVFKAFEELKFVKFTSPNNLAEIELPDNWNFYYDSTEDYFDMIITPEQLKNFNDFYFVGIRISYNKNMGKQYGVSRADSLIDFWKGSLNENMKDYHFYKPASQKMYVRGEFQCHTNKVFLQVTKESPKLKVIESAFAKNDNLIYVYMQAPDTQYSYFEKIFERALEKLILR